MLVRANLCIGCGDRILQGFTMMSCSLLGWPWQWIMVIYTHSLQIQSFLELIGNVSLPVHTGSSSLLPFL